MADTSGLQESRRVIVDGLPEFRHYYEVRKMGNDAPLFLANPFRVDQYRGTNSGFGVIDESGSMSDYHTHFVAVVSYSQPRQYFRVVERGILFGLYVYDYEENAAPPEPGEEGQAGSSLFAIKLPGRPSGASDGLWFVFRQGVVNDTQTAKGLIDQLTDNTGYAITADGYADGNVLYCGRSENDAMFAYNTFLSDMSSRTYRIPVGVDEYDEYTVYTVAKKSIGNFSMRLWDQAPQCHFGSPYGSGHSFPDGECYPASEYYSDYEQGYERPASMRTSDLDLRVMGLAMCDASVDKTHRYMYAFNTTESNEQSNCTVLKYRKSGTVKILKSKPAIKSWMYKKNKVLYDGFDEDPEEIDILGLGTVFATVIRENVIRVFDVPKVNALMSTGFWNWVTCGSHGIVMKVFCFHFGAGSFFATIYDSVCYKLDPSEDELFKFRLGDALDEYKYGTGWKKRFSVPDCSNKAFIYGGQLYVTKKNILTMSGPTMSYINNHSDTYKYKDGNNEYDQSAGFMTYLKPVEIVKKKSKINTNYKGGYRYTYKSSKKENFDQSKYFVECLGTSVVFTSDVSVTKERVSLAEAYDVFMASNDKKSAKTDTGLFFGFPSNPFGKKPS